MKIIPTPAEMAEEIFDLLLDALGADPSDIVAGAQRILREHVRQFTVTRNREGITVAIWMRDHWSYTIMSGKKVSNAIYTVAANYTEHVLGEARKPRIVIGRVNNRRPRTNPKQHP